MPRRRRASTIRVLVLAAVLVAGCGAIPGLGPSVDIPAGLRHRMSVTDVERTVRASVADEAAALGRVIRPLRVTSIRLVAPFERLWSGGPGATPSPVSFSTNTTTWVVQAEGTFRDCASTCAIYSAAVIVIDDARGRIVGRHAAGPTTLDATQR